MFKRKTHTPGNYPPEVAVTLPDLMRYEFLVQPGALLPNHPVYSLLAGRHASKLRGRGLDFEEVRPYVPGDDIRNIDWKVTARTGTTHSKVFNEEKERPTFIILDQSATLFFGSVRFVKSVSAAQAAALSAFYTLHRGDRVGGLIFNEEGHDYIFPKRSKALVQHFLQCVVNRNRLLPQRQHSGSNSDLLHKALDDARRTITHDYVITIISDFSDIDPRVEQQIKDLAYRNDVILVHISDPLEEQLPEGKLVLSDGEQQILWNNHQRGSGDRYKNDHRTQQARLSKAFRNRGVPFVSFHTASTIEEQVLQHLKDKSSINTHHL